MTVHSDILGSVDGEWRSARDIHRKLGMWSPVTVRNYLGNMALAGEVEERRTPHPGGAGVKSFFRRKQAAS